MAKHLYRNGLSYFGLLIAALGLILIIITLSLSYSFHEPSPYVGILAYLIFPGISTVGGFLFLYGMRRERKRRRLEGTEEPLPYPRLDLNDSTTRKKFGWMSLGATLGIVFGVYLIYNTFAWTESVPFCGTLCHTPMEPEYTTYQSSPHARVPCVECHVGHGVSWYVKAKLSGLYQLYAVATSSYSTPIETPIENLRPSRDTCEECHWPEKFYGTKLMQRPYFRFDEKNTAEQISLGIKIGGWLIRSIHYSHVVDTEEITYIALDHKLQEIPWVRVTRRDGTSEEYISLDFKGSPEKLEAMPTNLLDCIGCHNRPTHIYWTPTLGVDALMTAKRIPRDLPWIKKVAVEALVEEYPNSVTAHQGMQLAILGFYEKEYPEIYQSRREDLDNVIEAVRYIYDRNVFHDMKVSWKTYADNIGHKNWPGCFRCHDDKHVSKSGKIISKECTVCHTMPVRGPLQPMGVTKSRSGVPWHPMDLRGKHERILCNVCHAAGFRPPNSCAECHRLDKNAPMMSGKCDYCHMKVQEIQPLVKCADCHDALPGLHKAEDHGATSCTDCHQPHHWSIKGRTICLSCHDNKDEHPPEGGACHNCHSFQ